eukprot:TRINITY_DN4215_c0_g1_i14.p2 TRINITY_DN4215_c0_g1~~TRINITY_DN4215_c0_g1_i14.p2  ORF type:complete len:217 (-),score=-0.18 TRINITY_DN4215_c0_g1_i14:861-1511(-)
MQHYFPKDFQKFLQIQTRNHASYFTITILSKKFSRGNCDQSSNKKFFQIYKKNKNAAQILTPSQLHCIRYFFKLVKIFKIHNIYKYIDFVKQVFVLRSSQPSSVIPRKAASLLLFLFLLLFFFLLQQFSDLYLHICKFIILTIYHPLMPPHVLFRCYSLFHRLVVVYFCTRNELTQTQNHQNEDAQSRQHFENINLKNKNQINPIIKYYNNTQQNI